ncbi:MAG TPA: hypothetical protein VF656_11750 [Pyrinomonadaceae bacterium]|jgi:hypothetical protein
MSPEVNAAIITGILGLLGIFVTLYRDEFGNLLRKRRRNIRGLWVGEGNDLEVPPQLTYSISQRYDVSFKMKQSGNRISSEVVISLKDRSKHWEAEAEGGFISDSYIHVEYHITVEGALHFGTVILKISDLGDEMTGYYLAKRVVQEGIVFGQVRLAKSPGRQ